MRGADRAAPARGAEAAAAGASGGLPDGRRRGLAGGHRRELRQRSRGRAYRALGRCGRARRPIGRLGRVRDQSRRGDDEVRRNHATTLAPRTDAVPGDDPAHAADGGRDRVARGIRFGPPLRRPRRHSPTRRRRRRDRSVAASVASRRGSPSPVVATTPCSTTWRSSSRAVCRRVAFAGGSNPSSA